MRRSATLLLCFLAAAGCGKSSDGNADGGGGSGDEGGDGGTGGTAGGGGTGGKKDGGTDAPKDVAGDVSGDVNAVDANLEPTAFVYVGGRGTANIELFTLGLNTGTLTPLKPLFTNGLGGSNPTFLAWDATKKYLYSLSESAAPKAYAYEINAANGAIKFITPQVLLAPGMNPTHLSVHPSGKWIFLADYDSGHVQVVSVKTAGGLDALVQTLSVGKNPHMALPDSTGKFLFVPCKGSDYVKQLKFDDTTGMLSDNTAAMIATGVGDGPRHMAFHPTLPFAYVVNENSSSVISYKYDKATGLLSGPETVSTLPDGVHLNLPDGGVEPDAGAGGDASVGINNTGAEVAVYSNGKFVYASNRGHDSIVRYSVDQATGRLTRQAWETGGGMIKGPRHFSFDSTNKFMLVANNDSKSVMSFEIDGVTGKLTKLSGPVTTSATNPTFIGGP